jgi:septum formation protein
MKKRLFLASGSAGRRALLADAGIPFEVVDQDADESQVSLDAPLKTVVQNLAELKMDHVIFPRDIQPDQEIVIITADTLTVGPDGRFLGKPTSREHAVEMIRGHRGRSTLTGTGFCVEKRICVRDRWVAKTRILGYSEGYCRFEVGDEHIDFYLDRIPFLTVSGAVALGAGYFSHQFVQEIKGSYASIIGLPLFEVRHALQAVGFLD